MSGEAVQFEIVTDHIARVTLNRPQSRNAVNGNVAHRLEEIIEQTNADSNIRVVILTGAGSAFCAGADLKEVANGNVASLRTDRGGFAGFVKAERLKPWICVANGPAVAGGLEILLACDLAIAADSAVFSLPEVKRGLVAVAGGLFRLPRSIPRALAMEMIATGQSIDAQTAWRAGLISRICSQVNLQDEALQLAKSVAANAPLSVRQSLKVAREAYDRDTGNLFALCAGIGRGISESEDAKEGAGAFLERRSPDWKGS